MNAPMNTGGTWLFTRGSQSIRLVREEYATGCRLLMYGPGSELVTLDFGNLTDCIRGQATIEGSLCAEGYQLAQSSSDRRSHEGLGEERDQRHANTLGGSHPPRSGLKERTPDIAGPRLFRSCRVQIRSA